MRALKLASLVLALSPATALAADAGVQLPLVVPGIMTPAGQKFASLCSDAAFARVADPVARNRRCERVLAEWHSEASRRTDPLADRDSSKPGFLALRGIPRYPAR